MPASSTNTWGLGSGYNLVLNPNYEYGYNIPVSSSFCLQQCVCLSGGEYVASGCCFTFDFEITLTSCVGKEIECPPLTFSKQFPVCCYCCDGGGSSN